MYHNNTVRTFYFMQVVRQGILTATQDLQKENEDKLWQEGILRHVPVFGK